MNTLVVGGTSGLGLELARGFRDTTHYSEATSIYVTGDNDPQERRIRYVELRPDFELEEKAERLAVMLPRIDTLAYAVEPPDEKELGAILRAQLERHKKLEGLIAIVQRLPNLRQSEEMQIGNVLVVEPAVVETEELPHIASLVLRTAAAYKRKHVKIGTEATLVEVR